MAAVSIVATTHAFDVRLGWTRERGVLPVGLLVDGSGVDAAALGAMVDAYRMARARPSIAAID